MQLHSEWSDEESPSYYLEDPYEQKEELSWLTNEWRQLRSSGGGGGRSSSRSSGSSYGNCYGDRCDAIGGSGTQMAIIIGSVVGGCCVILGFYFLYHYCMDKRKKDEKRKRRQNGFGDYSENEDFDSDMPQEPIVIMPDQQRDETAYGEHGSSSSVMQLASMNPSYDIQRKRDSSF